MVMPRVSWLPGSPLSDIDSSSVALLSFVDPLPEPISRTLAFATTVTRPVDGRPDSEVGFPFTSQVCEPPRIIRLICPFRFVPLLLYFIEKPKLFFEPFAPPIRPADDESVRYPPPVMNSIAGLLTVIRASSSELLRM